MLYKFPTTRRTRKPYLETTAVDEQPDDEAPGLIQGQQADSKEEWMVAKALNRIGISYDYQYPVNGGNTRGGYKIDFVVHTVPLATMVEPIGNHWHTGELGADDRKRQADIEDSMRDLCRTPILLLWIPDLLDDETTYQKLRSELL